MLKSARENKTHNVAEEIRQLLKNNVAKAEVCRRLGVASSTVSFHANKLGMVKPRPTYDWNEIQKFVDEGHNEKDILKTFPVSARALFAAQKDGRINLPAKPLVVSKRVHKQRRAKNKEWLDNYISTLTHPREKREECVVWPFSKIQTGHGQLTVKFNNKKTVHIVSRLVCEAFYGPAPEGKPLALHTCKNNACIEPTHLYWAEHLKNTAREEFLKQVRGAGNPNAKFNNKQVEELRLEYAKQPFNTTKRAAELGCNRITLIAALKGKNYKELDVPPVKLVNVRERKAKMVKPPKIKLAKPTIIISDEVRNKALRYVKMGFDEKLVAKRLGLEVKVVRKLCSENRV